MLLNPSAKEILKLTIIDEDDEPVVASVTIGDVSKVSGIDGKVSFELEYGDYSATIVADGYQTKTENIAFRSNHKNFTITLEESSGDSGLSLVWDASKNATISILTVSPSEEPLDGIILSDGASAVIDWGDGTTTNYTQASDFEHTYTDSDEYTVTMTVSNGSIVGLDMGCFFDMDGIGALTSISLPNTVTSIGFACFSGCNGLTSIDLPNSITSLGGGCFEFCNGLTSISLPNTVTSLGEGCFNGCSGLTNITIPQSVTSLGEGCFNGCTGLTSITIPSSMESIGVQCFMDCFNLTSISMLPLVPPTFGEFAFRTGSDISMTVPQGTLQAYEQALQEYDNITITEQT